jgi:hypothetical protein
MGHYSEHCLMGCDAVVSLKFADVSEELTTSNLLCAYFTHCSTLRHYILRKVCKFYIIIWISNSRLQF